MPIEHSSVNTAVLLSVPNSCQYVYVSNAPCCDSAVELGEGAANTVIPKLKSNSNARVRSAILLIDLCFTVRPPIL